MDFTKIINYCDKEQILYKINEKTAYLTTIQVGGTADLIIFPENMQIFCSLLDIISLYKYKFVILGNGSNSFFTNHYDGIVIVTKYLDDIIVSNTFITAMCGASIYSLVRIALCHQLGGIEFAYGIPGTVGGAVYMNASAFGSSIQNVTSKSLIYDLQAREIREISLNEHKFEEKKSVFSKEKQYVILQTTFSLAFDEYDKIFEKMKNYHKIRDNNQPLDMPSAGSAFKRPVNNEPASKLIDMAGLKGYHTGGAEVSTKHAGFIVNSGNATPSDIIKLLNDIKLKVKNQFNVILDEEIIYIE